MRFFETLLFAITWLTLQVAAAPVNKRFFSPSSPTFSLIAVHNGTTFNSNLVKFNGSAIKLGSDDKAFFGTIQANKGYILNLPFTNNSNETSTINVAVSNSTHLLTTTTKNGSASEHFGITNGWLSYLNSTQFLACPESASNATATTNSTSNSTIEYDLFSNPLNKTQCETGQGYNVKLLVQLSVPISFSPESNSFGFFKRDNVVKRFIDKLFK
ncbi:hypothetical protein FOB58_001928 [Candida parapsilosis]|uniref:Hyphally-regulated cell wall protein N-terminal domain-containing protein n=2 Tax=Candida parapsilosis TaxID=5480 RepID=G8BA82_CANPC|nr:uncharacterized protein CPAR2_805040 [Candida parapsilosis]KAF6051868.1 hypothetical protein FOB58_001928 [Candida parapsilosis]KAF6052635.1 hypothetical protein FOB60_002891 [Candida parapsilosis]KAF6053670.1 hypothetical protein FOB59_001952 [Candida parapsilosis]KAF6064411.1 hypothetical protein FOB61_002837 [Candida parapsilosis]KAI5905795.1 hypothetical protein K4G60_g5066 [Candida parapsilosis]